MIDTNKIDARKTIKFLLRFADRPDYKVRILSYSGYNKYCNSDAKLAVEEFSEYGFCFGDNGESVIFINDKQPPDQRIYTVAHEVGHILLGHLSYNSGIDRKSQEWESNLFASIIAFMINGAVPYMEYYSGSLEGGATL